MNNQHLTAKEIEAVEKESKKYSENIWNNGRQFGSVKQYSKQDYFAGASFLAQLRSEEKPSEDLWRKITDILLKNHDGAGLTIPDFQTTAYEIANLFPK